MQPLLSLVGARTSEVKVNSNVEKEWYWLTGDWESAYLGIRTAATPGDLVAGSDNQEGMEWMRRQNQNCVRLCEVNVVMLS
jgi:hypothetical protein